MRFDARGLPVASAQVELPQHFPHDGWVEHDPEHIWDATRRTVGEVLTDDVVAIGITNQRETTVLWERDTGRPLARAIVWQDRRTSELCARLKAAGHEPLVQRRTGLLLDPYFSATKLAWLLDHVPDARARAERGELAAGTIDSFLIWRLTGGRVHATDATNASRTLLFDLRAQAWDDELLALFDVPRAILPDVRDCAGDFGATDTALFGRAIPITGVAGDQQAAAIGQGCSEPGMLKSTYGTGCFALLNTGADVVPSTHRLLTTVADRRAGRATYALEGSIFSAGSTVQWLRDGLGLVATAGESDARAARSDRSRRVYLVPAFTGLGAPWWDADARAAIIGLTRDATGDDIVRAGLESVAFQTRDLLDAMTKDGAASPRTLRVDGGMVASDWTMQALADLTGLPVERPIVHETTARGAAALAAAQVGAPFEASFVLERRFEPLMSADERDDRCAGWRAAVGRVLRRDDDSRARDASAHALDDA